MQVNYCKKVNLEKGGGGGGGGGWWGAFNTDGLYNTGSLWKFDCPA